jgi:transposase
MGPTPTELQGDTEQAQLTHIIRTSDSILLVKRAQCVLLWKQYNLPPDDIAFVVGWSAGTVQNFRTAYKKYGMNSLKPAFRGGRRNAALSLDREKLLLKTFANRARSTGYFDVKSLKAAYEHLVGHRSATSTIYRLIHRHGLACKLPRQRMKSHLNAKAGKESAAHVSSPTSSG